MWRKIAVAGATTAVILGAGGAALATSGTVSAGSGAAVSGVAAAAAGERPGHPGIRAAARNVLHGQFVTRHDGEFVTHTVARGAVTAVSSTSITVKAADGVSETFAVTGDTKVHRRGDRGTALTIADVKTGATAFVAGTGTDPVTATHVVLAAK